MSDEQLTDTPITEDYIPDTSFNDMLDALEGVEPEGGFPSAESDPAPAEPLAAEQEGAQEADGADKVGAGAGAQIAGNEQSAGVAPQEEDSQVLRAQLDQALGMMAQLKQQLSGPQADLTHVEVPQVATELTNVDWLQGKDPTDFFEDGAAFNQLLNRMFTVAVRTAEASAHEKVVTAIPGIVAKSAQQHMDLQLSVKEFYTTNPDLANFKQAVSLAATAINAAEPNLPLTDLFKKAGEKTRELLRMRKASAPVTPAFASAGGGGGARMVKPQLTDLEAQISALLEV